MKILPIAAALIRADRQAKTDGQTDGHD